jgi:hypothetical protein
MLSAEGRIKFDQCCDRIHDLAFLDGNSGVVLCESDLLGRMDYIDGENDAASEDEMDVATDCETAHTFSGKAQNIFLSDERKEFCYGT